MNFWRRHKKALSATLIFAGFFFLLGFFKRYHVPQIKRWVLFEIEDVSRRRSPIALRAQEVDLHLFPPGATFYRVDVRPQGTLTGVVAPTSIEEVSASLSIWGLIRGQIKLGEVRVKGTVIGVSLDAPSLSVSTGSSTRENGKTKPAKKWSLQEIYDLPLERVRLQDLKLLARSPSSQFSGAAVISDLKIDNKYDSLRVALQMQNLKIQKSGVVSTFEADIAAQMLVDDEGLYLSQFRVDRKGSSLSGSGSLTGELAAGKFKTLRAKVSGRLDLNELRSLAADLAEIKLPAMSGQAEVETEFESALDGPLHGSYRVSGRELRITHYDIGALEARGELHQDNLKVTKAELRHHYGHIEIKNAEFGLKNNSAFRAEVSSPNLVLKSLFNALDLKGVPVWAGVVADLPCQGVLKPSFQITCTGKLEGRDLAVKSGPTLLSHSIVDFKNFKIDGSVNIDNQAVSYKTKIAIGASQGTTDGVISYQDGFKINYATEALNFADISNLVGLRPEGTVKLKGQTVGTSQTATIDMASSGENLWLSDFFLGRAQWKMRYRQGRVFFDNLQGQAGNTTYKADVQVDVTKNTFSVDGQLPFLDAEDLNAIFARKIRLPVAVTGTGSAVLKVWGPLDIMRLSYQARASLFRGSVAEETYDQARVSVTSTDGQVRIESAHLNKGRSQIGVQGQISHSGPMDLHLTGRDFRIEQSENLARLKVRLTGNLGFDLKAQGSVQAPQVEASATVTEALIGESPAEDSLLRLRINDHELSGDGRLLGDSIGVKFARVFAPSGHSSLEFNFQRWNFAQTFSIFSDSARQNGYQTEVSGHFGLQVPNTKPENFSADLRIDNLIMRNNRAEMTTAHPLQLSVANGRVVANNFEIKGENTYIRLTTPTGSDSRSLLSAEGRLDLALASLFTPFLDDIRGRLSFSLHLNGPLTKPSISGSTYIENGLFRLKGLPHSFEYVQGDAVISEDKMILNAVKGRFAGGLFSASGKIQVNGITDVGVDIKGHVQDAKLNVPEGFHTRGSADVYVRGSWFPYTIGVNYVVESGLIERRTATTETTSREVKPSPYLPKALSAQRFSPVALALDVSLRRPIPVKMTISRVEILCDVNGDMHIAGPPESPRLSGRIGIARGGKVTFLNKTFDLRASTVLYANSPPDNPTLDIQGDAKLTGQLRNGETRDYDVNIHVLGPVATRKIAMTSEPPLPETEVVSLLMFGVINEGVVEETDVSGKEQMTSTGYQLGSAVLNEQLGINRVLENRLGVRFDFNSAYDTADKAEKHIFTLRKQWTPKFGTSASREIGKTNSNNVKAEYKLNKNLSVIGEWEGTESTGAETVKKAESENIFGVDIEYKVEFK